MVKPQLTNFMCGKGFLVSLMSFTKSVVVLEVSLSLDHGVRSHLFLVKLFVLEQLPTLIVEYTSIERGQCEGVRACGGND